MRKITDEIYNQINNNIYNSEQTNWWSKDSPFNLIESVLNPVRVNYFSKVLTKLKVDSVSMNALEVGCGGGILTEAIARMGFTTTGIDPSELSLANAEKHSLYSGLSIKYIKAYGEDIPFSDESFDVIFCCDVMEHVKDLQVVINEISRVLKPHGIFLYDTINKTILSRLIVIKIMQDWKRFAVLPPDLHVWKMFIRPSELKELLHLSKLDWQEHRGIKNDGNILNLLRNLHRRASGKMSFDEFSAKCRLTEGKHLNVSYMGYAIKM